MIENLSLLLLTGGFVGAAAGYLGSFMVLKRMSLTGDALSHVALPGIALGLALNFSPILFALIALLIAVILIWHFEETSPLYPEALVGVLFTASLAAGLLLTPEPELLEALFGNIEKISLFESAAVIASSIFIFLATAVIARRLILGTISKDLVRSLGISTKRINLIYLLLVGAVVALGVRFIGTLLMGALVIIPAASAKNVSQSLRHYHALSTLFGIVSAIAGVSLANFYHLSSGPLVVLSSIVIFLLTYLAKSLI